MCENWMYNTTQLKAIPVSYKNGRVWTICCWEICFTCDSRLTYFNYSSSIDYENPFDVEINWTAFHLINDSFYLSIFKIILVKFLVYFSPIILIYHLCKVFVRDLRKNTEEMGKNRLDLKQGGIYVQFIIVVTGVYYGSCLPKCSIHLQICWNKMLARKCDTSS